MFLLFPDRHNTAAANDPICCKSKHMAVLPWHIAAGREWVCLVYSRAPCRERVWVCCCPQIKLLSLQFKKSSLGGADPLLLADLHGGVTVTRFQIVQLLLLGCMRCCCWCKFHMCISRLQQAPTSASLHGCFPLLLLFFFAALLPGFLICEPS